MPVSDKNTRIMVTLPKEYVEDIDNLISRGRQSRSAVVKDLLDMALGRSALSFSLPNRSVNKSDQAQADHPADAAA